MGTPVWRVGLCSIEAPYFASSYQYMALRSINTTLFLKPLFRVCTISGFLKIMLHKRPLELYECIDCARCILSTCGLVTQTESPK